jgi:aspartate-semialdehyde dehydrogenase
MKKLGVAVLGATGSVGQRFVQLLADHPWFELRALAASDRNAGRSYGEAVRWVQDAPLPPGVGKIELIAAHAPDTLRSELGVDIAFSALDAAVAGPIEAAFREAGCLVVTNAAPHRMDADVPLVVPEVNPGHLDLLVGRIARGAIVANPNCSTIGLVLALAPLARAFGVRRAHVVTLQALSGAGVPGVASMEILDNVVPFIAGEEEKLASETRKILGELEGRRLTPAEVVVSAQCNRVPVLDGHTECVSVELGTEVTGEEILAAWSEFRSEPQERSLPSAPERPVVYLDDPAAPQPRKHRDLGSGMTCSIGRLSPCPVLGWKFVCLSHNTLRGAAGGALLTAELAVARGLLLR